MYRYNSFNQCGKHRWIKQKRHKLFSLVATTPSTKFMGITAKNTPFELFENYLNDYLITIINNTTKIIFKIVSFKRSRQNITSCDQNYRYDSFINFPFLFFYFLALRGRRVRVGRVAAGVETLQEPFAGHGFLVCSSHLCHHQQLLDADRVGDHVRDAVHVLLCRKRVGTNQSNGRALAGTAGAKHSRYVGEDVLLMLSNSCYAGICEE